VAQGRLTILRAAAGLAAAFAIAAELRHPSGATWLSMLDVAVALAFAAGAAADARVSPWLAAAAIAVAAGWAFGTVAPGAEPALAHRAPLAVLLLAYPGGPLRGAAVRALALVAIVAPFAPGAGAAASAGALALVAALLAARSARASAVLRAPLIAAATAAAAIAAAAAGGAAGLGDPTELLAVYDVVLLVSAVGLLAPLATGRWSATAAAGLVAELDAGPAQAPLTARLAELLRDPRLELRVRAPGGSWTDEAGRLAPDPAAHSDGRALTRRRLADGTELALVHDAAAIADRTTADAAVAVAATAVDNTRREREVRERIEELRRLRRSLLDAADDERRQLEDELRAGPLREADRLTELLAMLPGGRAADLRDELALARSELTAIAQGLYPNSLAHEGLSGALASAAARCPVPVALRIGVDGTALSEPTALTAYFVATEALANIAKHACAARAQLQLSTRGEELLLRITDDGVGGADPSGSGLSGLRERVAAVDGTLSVVSPPGDGTVVEARLHAT
jgi:hypothetical protein